MAASLSDRPWPARSVDQCWLSCPFRSPPGDVVLEELLAPLPAGVSRPTTVTTPKPDEQEMIESRPQASGHCSPQLTEVIATGRAVTEDRSDQLHSMASAALDQSAVEGRAVPARCGARKGRDGRRHTRFSPDSRAVWTRADGPASRWISTRRDSSVSAAHHSNARRHPPATHSGRETYAHSNVGSPGRTVVHLAPSFAVAHHHPLVGITNLGCGCVDDGHRCWPSSDERSDRVEPVINLVCANLSRSALGCSTVLELRARDRATGCPCR